MTENEGDLISREALKEAVINNFDNLQAYFPKDFIEEIDNAPTVDTDEIYKKGYHAGFFATHGEPERPQGEWVIDNWGMYHCNHCMKEKQQLFNNFCSFCGAEMRKENDNG